MALYDSLGCATGCAKAAAVARPRAPPSSDRPSDTAGRAWPAAGGPWVPKAGSEEACEPCAQKGRTALAHGRGATHCLDRSTLVHIRRGIAGMCTGRAKYRASLQGCSQVRHCDVGPAIGVTGSEDECHFKTFTCFSPAWGLTRHKAAAARWLARPSAPDRRNACGDAAMLSRQTAFQQDAIAMSIVVCQSRHSQR